MRDEKFFPAVFGYREYEPGEVIYSHCPVCRSEQLALPTTKGSLVAVLSRHSDSNGSTCSGSTYTVGAAAPAHSAEMPKVRKGPSATLLAARAERDRKRAEIILKRYQRRKT